MSPRVVEHVLVSLVGDDPQVVGAGKLHDFLQPLDRQDGTRRVVRRVDEDCARARRDCGLDPIGTVLEIVRGTELHAHGNATRHPDVLDYLRPHWIRNYHLVARNEQGAEGDEERVHRTIRDEDVVARHASEVIAVAYLGCQRVAQLRDSVVRYVVRLSGARCDIDRVEHWSGDAEAGIARLEAKHAHAGRLGLEQLLPDLDDLPERDRVEVVNWRGSRCRFFRISYEHLSVSLAWGW